MTTPHFPETDPGPVPEPLTEREQIIRGIHRFADWLTAHPGVTPTHFEATAYQGSFDEVGRWADESGAQRKASGETAWARLIVSASQPKIELVWFISPRRDADDGPAVKWARGEL